MHHVNFMADKIAQSQLNDAIMSHTSAPKRRHLALPIPCAPLSSNISSYSYPYLALPSSALSLLNPQREVSDVVPVICMLTRVERGPVIRQRVGAV